MTERQAGLRFDIYERVHLSDELAGIKEMDEIELLPQIQVRAEGDQAILKGNLWLTGKYVGEEDDRLLSLEHFIPVEITLPMNRVHRMEDVSVEIENFDFDLLSSRTMNVTGVLSLSGIEMTSPESSRWREEEEVVFVHEAVEYGDISPRAPHEPRLAAEPPGAQTLETDIETPESEPSSDQVTETAASPEQPYASQPGAGGTGGTEPFVVETPEWEPRTAQSSGTAWPPEQEPRTAQSSGTAWPPEQEPRTAQSSGTAWAPDQEPRTAQSSGTAWTPEQEPRTAQSPGTAWAPDQEPRTAQSPGTAWPPGREQRAAKAPEPERETQHAEPQPGGQEEAAQTEELSIEASAGILDEATYADEQSRPPEPELPHSEAEDEKKELKIAFTGKPAGEFEHLNHLKSIAVKSETRKDSANGSAAEPVVPADHGRETIEWKKLLGASNQETQFRRLRMCIVQKEETIESIADRYQINPREIVLYNRLGSQPLAEGQVICIP